MWNELWHDHRGSLLGLACGILLGFIYLFFGFWSMLVFTFIVFISFFVGRYYGLIDLFIQDISRRIMERYRP